VALVTGDGAAGQAVLQAADCLSFTGSVPVGRLIVAEAARRGIAVQAELGGSNAAIIDSSADLDAAAADLASAIFSFAGQRCTAIRRVLVVNGIFDDFVDKLVARVEELRVGNPSDPATEVGPVVSRQCQQQFLNLAGSGNVLAGGNVPEGVSANGCWVSPTLLTDLPDGHALLSREVFGPIAALARVDSLEAAIAVHNATPMGLVGALFSEDEQSKSRFLAEAQAGILSINRARPPFAAEGPFVGWKTSGYGPPEHGRWNRDFYTRVQAVYD
jgi:aldehyde dehydrogenase (NAD+)